MNFNNNKIKFVNYDWIITYTTTYVNKNGTVDECDFPTIDYKEIIAEFLVNSLYDDLELDVEKQTYEIDDVAIKSIKIHYSDEKPKMENSERVYISFIDSLEDNNENIYDYINKSIIVSITKSIESIDENIFSKDGLFAIVFDFIYEKQNYELTCFIVNENEFVYE